MKVILLLFTSCLAVSPLTSAFAAQDTRANVHFFRERAYTGSLRKMPIYVDEVKIADLVNGRYFTTKIDPGKHVFRCQTKTEAIEVQMEAGEEYYLRAELIQGFTKNHWRLIQVTGEQGEADIQKLKPLDAEDIAPLARGEGSTPAPEQPGLTDKPAQEAAARSTAQPNAGAPQQFTTVAVKSMPDGADINVDSKFVGNTPSTIQLSPGEHTIIIQKSGFKNWQRTVTIGAAGTITIDATLQND